MTRTTPIGHAHVERFFESRLELRYSLFSTGRSLTVAYGLRGSRIVNSLHSPTLLSTAMLPPCCCVTMS